MEKNEPAYTPKSEYMCRDSDTHYQGCQCHEARWQKRISELKAERDDLLKDLRETKAQALPLIGESSRFRAALERITRECNAMNKGPVAVMMAREALGVGMFVGEELRRRYFNNTKFHQLVRWMENIMDEHILTPREMEEALFVAKAKFYEREDEKVSQEKRGDGGGK